MEDPVDIAPATPAPRRDPFAGVVLVLTALAAVGAVGAFVLASASAVVADAGIALGIGTGALIGVVTAQRRRRAAEHPPFATTTIEAAVPVPAPERSDETTEKPGEPPKGTRRLTDALEEVGLWTGGVGLLTVLLAAFTVDPTAHETTWSGAGLAAACLLGAAGLAAMAARYLGDVDADRLPEAPGLCRGGRTLAWTFVVLALATGAAAAKLTALVETGNYLVLGIAGVACGELIWASWPGRRSTPNLFPIDLGVTALLGSRPNVVASVLDTCQQRLGIDLRSTWALTVVRGSIVPLALALAVVGWLSTSVSIVHQDEQALIQRLGVPIEGRLMQPGIHLHYPWPVDRAIRIPMQRVRSLTVGHEGEQEQGPENVLWARQHAANEYTLLLGDGRDLITIDAAVQFKIVDARAWTYNCQNPGEALRAIAYRAVMRSTVNRTLADALSENVATLTSQMRDVVQHDADTLGLGVDIVGFTVGGMHPPVAVASDYQRVVSAELGKATAIVEAQSHRNQIVPAAKAEVITSTNAARAQGDETLAKAAGEAWSFRALESQYNAARDEYRFRRRLEALEGGLASRPFTVVDARILRDGGGLWLTQ